MTWPCCCLIVCCQASAGSISIKDSGQKATWITVSLSASPTSYYVHRPILLCTALKQKLNSSSYPPLPPFLSSYLLCVPQPLGCVKTPWIIYTPTDTGVTNARKREGCGVKER